jgi:myo-inositol-1(or 4)-monophosphatase
MDPLRSRSPVQELLAATATVVAASGDIVREHWHKPRNIRHKGPKDLVTETDVAVEQFLRERLKAVVPEAMFLGEEESATQGLQGLVWVVDPVDGTTNFAHGVPFVATSVALCQDGQPILGVVNLPILGELFTTASGCGAHMNGSPIHVSETTTLVESLIATGFPYNIAPHLRNILHQLEAAMPATQGVRRPGAAALDLAYVACGRFDGFFEFALNPWDTAAGILLITEAGGRVGRMAGNEVFRLGDPDILGSNGHVHEFLQGMLKDAAQCAAANQ